MCDSIPNDWENETIVFFVKEIYIMFIKRMNFIRDLLVFKAFGVCA